MTQILSELFSGVLYLFTAAGLKTLLMFVISGILIYLAIKKEYEPSLLLPIGFGCILANLPPVLGTAFPSALGEEGFLTVLFNAGIANELFPILIFIAVGAMIDFSPLLKDPSMIFFGAAAQFGIFATFLLSLFLIPILLPQTADEALDPEAGECHRHYRCGGRPDDAVCSEPFQPEGLYGAYFGGGVQLHVLGAGDSAAGHQGFDDA